MVILGGMGSLIGTPPNAIAVGALSQLDDPIDISFLQWMILGLPVGALAAQARFLARQVTDPQPQIAPALVAIQELSAGQKRHQRKDEAERIEVPQEAFMALLQVGDEGK